MGGARPRRTIVISPATGPVWAAHPTAPSLPTAALLRPWWPLQTRRVTAWRAPVLAREVCACVWTGASLPVTDDLSRSALIPPAVILWLMIHTEMLLGRLAARARCTCCSSRRCSFRASTPPPLYVSCQLWGSCWKITGRYLPLDNSLQSSTSCFLF